jgi:iron(III) transport system ATP-binding protein
VVSLLGPSGSGKTTLLRAVAGLEKPTSGLSHRQNTVYDGTPRSEIPAEARNLGLVFQSYALWPHKTVFENVAYPLKLRKVAAAEIKQRVQRCWISWVWGILATAIRTSSPEGSSSAWPSAGRWFTTRR